MPTVNYGIAVTADDTTIVDGTADPTVTLAGNASAFGITTVNAGLRFVGVAVPQGSTITSATLTLKRNDAAPVLGTSSSGSAWGTIKGANVDNVASWATSPAAIAKTTASVTITNSATVAYTVTSIVQEIVNRAGWVSGNGMGFATDPSGANGHIEWIDRAASSTDCGQLSITYTAGGPTSYTLTADAGSFLLTGQAVSLVGPVRPAMPQNYFRKFPRFRGGSDVWYDNASIVTGPEFWGPQAAGYTLVAASGSFTLTGQPANLVYTPSTGSYTLTAATGSFSLTGQAAGLRASRRLTAAQGAFALTGIAAVLRASRKLVSAVGSFVLTGQAAGLRASRKLTAAQGSFSLAGQSVNLRVSRKIAAGQGSFSLSGQAAGLRVSRKITLDAGAFTLTGQDAGLVYTPAANSYTLTADFGAFTLSGQTAGLRAFRKLTANRGLFAVSGQDATLTYIASFEPFVPSGRRVSIAQRNRFVSTNARERSVEVGQRSRFIQTAARVRTIDISPRKRAVP